MIAKEIFWEYQMGVMQTTNQSPGSVCLIRKGKFIWVSGDVEKEKMDGK